MKPEEMARLKIDQLLEAAGWQVQNLTSNTFDPVSCGEQDYNRAERGTGGVKCVMVNLLCGGLV